MLIINEMIQFDSKVEHNLVPLVFLTVPNWPSFIIVSVSYFHSPHYSFGKKIMALASSQALVSTQPNLVTNIISICSSGLTEIC